MHRDGCDGYIQTFEFGEHDNGQVGTRIMCDRKEVQRIFLRQRNVAKHDVKSAAFEFAGRFRA